MKTDNKVSMCIRELTTRNLMGIDKQKVNLQPQAKITLIVYAKDYVQFLTYERGI